MLLAATDVDVSALGLVLGFVLGVICFFLGHEAAKRTGQQWLYYAGIIVGAAVFLLLGFDVYTTGDDL